MSSTYSTPGQTRFTKYDYSSLGLLLKETRYSENDSVKVFTNYEYDTNNLLARESYVMSSEPHWVVYERAFFPNGKLKKYVSYFQTLDILSMDKKPESVRIYNEQGNEVESSVYNISGEKISYIRTTYVCRD